MFAARQSFINLPIIGSTSNLIPNDLLAGDQFGYSVAISSDGNYAVVGANKEDHPLSNAGSAYVFIKQNGLWFQQAKLTATDGTNNDNFGVSVAINSTGDYIFVGADSTNGNGAGAGAGSAYVYTRSGTTWTQQQIIQGTVISGGLGSSVSINSTGDIAIIGEYGYNTSQGRSHVYTRTGTIWSLQQTLTASDGAANDNFGWSVDIDSAADYAIVGAYGKNTVQGAAYIYIRSGSTWTQQAKIIGSDAATLDFFGNSVSINSTGNYVIVGAFSKTVGANTDQGAVYVFSRTGTTWTQQQRIVAADGAANDFFGQSVSMNSTGDYVIIGASGDDDLGAGAGSSYVYTRSGTTWSLQQKITAIDGSTGDNFGWSADINGTGDGVIIGAYTKSPSGKVGAGAVYVYTRSGAVWG